MYVTYNKSSVCTVNRSGLLGITGKNEYEFMEVIVWKKHLWAMHNYTMLFYKVKGLMLKLNQLKPM